MKNLTLAAIMSVVLSGCGTIETFTTWIEDNDSSMLLVRVATAEAVFQGDAESICNRAARGSDLVNRLREVVNNDVFEISTLDASISRTINASGINPVTAEILLDIASKTVAEHKSQVLLGVASEDARITLNAFFDAAQSVLTRASVGC